MYAGAPLSALDGVLVGVKDEIDYVPYPTSGGTRCLSSGSDEEIRDTYKPPPPPASVRGHVLIRPALDVWSPVAGW